MTCVENARTPATAKIIAYKHQTLISDCHYDYLALLNNMYSALCAD